MLANMRDKSRYSGIISQQIKQIKQWSVICYLLFVIRHQSLI